MGTIICYLFIYFVEALIFSQYCSTIFTCTANPVIRYGSLTLIYSFLFGISFLANPYLNTGLFLLLNLLYLHFIFHTKWLTSLFHAFIVTSAMGFSEVIILALFSNFAYDFYKNLSHFGNLSLLSISSKLLYFLILYFISHHFSSTEKNSSVSARENILLCLVPILSIWIMITFVTLCINIDLPRLTDFMIILSAFFILLINILIFGIYEYTQKKNAEFTNLQLQLQKESDYSQYYKMLLEQDENQKILIHDIKKHLQSISALNEQGDSEKISLYLERILLSSDFQTSVRLCSHDLLNAILCRYHKECTSKQISINFDIRNHCIDFLQDDDLSALFCNLLDNAIESAEKVSDSFIELSVHKKENTRLTIITMENSCRTNPFLNHTNLLASTKKNASKHGFGMKSIQRIVDKYEGDLRTYYDDEHLSFHTILILKSNL
ncbi:MAG: sensor histidine kinase [Roseburia sp.]